MYFAFAFLHLPHLTVNTCCQADAWDLSPAQLLISATLCLKICSLVCKSLRLSKPPVSVSCELLPTLAILRKAFLNVVSQIMFPTFFGTSLLTALWAARVKQRLPQCRSGAPFFSSTLHELGCPLPFLPLPQHGPLAESCIFELLVSPLSSASQEVSPRLQIGCVTFVIACLCGG